VQYYVFFWRPDAPLVGVRDWEKVAVAERVGFYSGSNMKDETKQIA